MARPKPIIVSSQPLEATTQSASIDLGPLMKLLGEKKRKSNLIEDFKEARGQEQLLEEVNIPSEPLLQETPAPTPKFGLDALRGLSGVQQPQADTFSLDALRGLAPEAPKPERGFSLTDLPQIETPEVSLPEITTTQATPEQVAAFRGLLGTGGPQAEARIAKGFGDIAFPVGSKEEKVESFFSKINPKDFTQDSVGKFEKSGTFSDLIPREKASQGRLGGKSKFDAEAILRKEYTKLSSDFRLVRDANARINESSKDPTAAGDLALIFNYMKMLDPNSVVRESEFATAENAAGVPDRVRNIWNKVVSGEKLALNQRDDFVSRAEQLFSRQEAQHEQRKKVYNNLATNNKLNPKNIIINFSDPVFELEKIDREIRALEGKGAK